MYFCVTAGDGSAPPFEEFPAAAACSGGRGTVWVPGGNLHSSLYLSEIEYRE